MNCDSEFRLIDFSSGYRSEEAIIRWSSYGQLLIKIGSDPDLPESENPIEEPECTLEDKEVAEIMSLPLNYPRLPGPVIPHITGLQYAGHQHRNCCHSRLRPIRRLWCGFWELGRKHVSIIEYDGTDKGYEVVLEILPQIANHSTIQELHFNYIIDERVFLGVELAENDLEDVLKKIAQNVEDQFKSIVGQIFTGFQHIHGSGFGKITYLCDI